MKLLKIFLDTSVILSGLASSTGGSRKLFEAASAKKLKLVTCFYAIEEAADHLDKLKINPNQLSKLLTTKIVYLVKNPSEKVIEKFIQVSPDPNDAPILAAALLCGADFLVSLDKKHILTPKVRKTLKPMKIASPKDFWKWVGKRKQ